MRFDNLLVKADPIPYAFDSMIFLVGAAVWALGLKFCRHILTHFVSFESPGLRTGDCTVARAACLGTTPRDPGWGRLCIHLCTQKPTQTKGGNISAAPPDPGPTPACPGPVDLAGAAVRLCRRCLQVSSRCPETLCGCTEAVPVGVATPFKLPFHTTVVR